MSLSHFSPWSIEVVVSFDWASYDVKRMLCIITPAYFYLTPIQLILTRIEHFSKVCIENQKEIFCRIGFCCPVVAITQNMCQDIAKIKMEHFNDYSVGKIKIVMNIPVQLQKKNEDQCIDARV